MRRRLFIAMTIIVAAFPAGTGADGIKEEKNLITRLTPGEKKEYDGLQYILGDSQKTEYLSLETARERSQWLAGFWLRVDPTPTTDENEARREHEARVEAARNLFGMDEAPGWDGRGEILIRFGAPSLRTSEMGDVTTTGLIFPSELWYYAPLNMTVRFVDINLKGRFSYQTPQKTMRVPGPPERLVSDGETLRGRGPYTPPNIEYTADELVREMEMQAAPHRLTVLEQMRSRRADDNFAIAMDRFAAVYSCDTEWLPLPFFFDVVSFRGGDWMDRTEVSFEVPTELFGHAGDKPESSAEIELRVLVRDENLHKVASGEDRLRLAPAGDSSAPTGFVPGQIVLPVEPGRYEIGVEAIHRHSNRRAAFRRKVDLPAFSESPSLSEIQFASSVAETEENTKFVKGGMRVVPHPLHEYSIPSPIIFYFEIYNLRTDEEGIAQYRIEYRIVPLEKRRWGPVLMEVPTRVSSMFETSGYGSTQSQWLSIATNELWHGPFRLDVTVTDRTTGATVSRSAPFSLFE